MTRKPKEHYDALAAWAESYTPTLDPANPPLTGADAAAAGRAMLEAATEDDPAGREQVRRAAHGGRPSLDPETPGETSPQWQVRAPRSLDTAMRLQACAEGRTLSELLRDAASQYLATRAS